MLTQAERCPSSVTVYEQALLWLYGHGEIEATALPAAACCQVADFHESSPNTVCADPVWLKPDTDHARLFSAASVDLDDSDSSAMIESLNEHFADDDLIFSRSRADRWFMTGKSGSGLSTLPVSAIAGRNVQSFLPVDAASREWRQLTTEIQMLLHAHPANERRAERGLAPVNSIWFWGGDSLGKANPSINFRLYADDAFSRGLARLNSQRAYPLHEGLSAMISGGIQVVGNRGFESAIISGKTDSAEKALYETTQLLEAALGHLKRGRLGEIALLSGDRQLFRLKRAALFKFWKRGTALDELLELSAGSGRPTDE